MLLRVLCSDQAPWVKGEHEDDRDVRVAAHRPVSYADLYPDCFPGRVISAIPASLEFNPADTIDPSRRVLVMDVDDADVPGVKSRRYKVVLNTLADVTFNDRYGAVAAKMREKHLDPEAFEREEAAAVEAAEAANSADRERYDLEAAAYRIARQEYAKVMLSYEPGLGAEPPVVPVLPEPLVFVEREDAFLDEATALAKSLPKTVARTGAGLYKVDASGSTHNDTIAAFDENLLLESERFEKTTWVKSGAPVVITDTDIAPNGKKTADTVTDDDIANLGFFRQDVSIPDDSNWIHSLIHVKKDLDTSRFPGFQFWIIGGTLQYMRVQLNTSTGGFLVTSFVGTVTSNVTDLGSFWRIELGVKNNASGNTTGRLYLYPAITTTWGNTEVTATGSIVIWGAQITLLSFKDYKPTRSTADTSVTLTTGGLTDGDRDGEVFVSGGNGYAVIRNGTDSVLVVGNATGEAGACTVSPYSTIQSAVDQLWADQGSATFTATQEIRIFTGTYNEQVSFPAFVPKNRYKLLLKAASGNPPVLDCTGLASALTSSTATHLLEIDGLTISGVATGIYPIDIKTTHVLWFRNCTITCTGTGVYQFNTQSTGCHFENCELQGGIGATHIGSHFFASTSFFQCKIHDYNSAILRTGRGGVLLEACTIWNCGWLILGAQSYYHGTLTVHNCTFYNMTGGLVAGTGTAQTRDWIIMKNNIFHTVVKIFNEGDASDKFDHGRADIDSNCYYNVTKWLDSVTDPDITTFADWQARGYDAGGMEADPLFTNPGAGDFSLEDDSPCRNAGVGAGVIKGINDVDLDPYHPDIGAWSSGPRVWRKPEELLEVA